jgi:hypothetical protein
MRLMRWLVLGGLGYAAFKGYQAWRDRRATSTAGKAST